MSLAYLHMNSFFPKQVWSADITMLFILMYFQTQLMRQYSCLFFHLCKKMDIAKQYLFKAEWVFYHGFRDTGIPYSGINLFYFSKQDMYIIRKSESHRLFISVCVYMFLLLSFPYE